jgi:hypothetical protein
VRILTKLETTFGTNGAALRGKSPVSWGFNSEVSSEKKGI